MNNKERSEERKHRSRTFSCESGLGLHVPGRKSTHRQRLMRLWEENEISLAPFYREFLCIQHEHQIEELALLCCRGKSAAGRSGALPALALAHLLGTDRWLAAQGYEAQLFGVRKGARLGYKVGIPIGCFSFQGVETWSGLMHGGIIILVLLAVFSYWRLHGCPLGPPIDFIDYQRTVHEQQEQRSFTEQLSINKYEKRVPWDPAERALKQGLHGLITAHLQTNYADHGSMHLPHSHKQINDAVSGYEMTTQLADSRRDQRCLCTAPPSVSDRD